MDEPGIEIDIAALFEAEPLHGERFSIYVPNKDRNGTLERFHTDCPYPA